MAEERKAIQCKVVLIGESGVGKTSIISRYISDTFSSVLSATPGANFTTKTVFMNEANQSIKFEINLFLNYGKLRVSYKHLQPRRSIR